MTKKEAKKLKVGDPVRMIKRVQIGKDYGLQLLENMIFSGIKIVESIAGGGTYITLKENLPYSYTPAMLMKVKTGIKGIKK